MANTGKINEIRLFVWYLLCMRIYRSIERITARYRRWDSQRAIRNSTARAEQQLPSNPLGVLVDSNVHHHAVTHETSWISTGTATFGSSTRGTGYASRVPVFRQSSKSKAYENVCHLAAIAQLAKIGKAKLWTSHHLILERDKHPRARFADIGWFDFNLFGRGELPSIDGDAYDKIMMAPFSINSSPPPDISTTLAKSKDELYLNLVRVMGGKNSQDAWHIRTAEVHGLYCFLTMETKLLKIMHAQRDRPVIRNLKTRVMSPKMLSEALNLRPIALKHFDHKDSSWFVRPDLHWEGEKRPANRRAK